MSDLIERARNRNVPYGWPELADKMAARIERLEALVRDAYNEGFSQGMREVQTSCGGLTFVDSKARAALARGR